MMDTQDREQYCRRRGRPRVNQSLAGSPSPRCYEPQCYPNEERDSVEILPEQMAVLDLIDVKGFTQEEAAALMGISRKTVWRDIHEARRMIIDALLNGKSIRVNGCSRKLRGYCPHTGYTMCRQENGGTCHRTMKPIPSDTLDNQDTPE